MAKHEPIRILMSPTHLSELQRNILLKAAELAEPAVMLRSPFDRILGVAALADLKRMRKDIETLSETKKKELLESMVAVARFFIAGELVRDQPAMERFMEYDRSLLSVKSMEYLTRSWPDRAPELKEKPIIKEVMKLRYTQFRYDPSPFKVLDERVAGNNPFTCDFGKDNNIIIAIELRPPKSTRFVCHVGIADPLYLVRIGSFWAANSLWYYHDETSLVRALHEALDVVDIVLPPFLEKIGEILNNPRL